MQTPTAQAPGIYHYKVGARLVTAILDGGFVGSYDLVTRLPAGEAEALNRAAFRDGPLSPTISAFVIWNDSGKPVLVDTGAGGQMGPSGGRLPAALAQLGIDPADVSAVLLTHFHLDHIGSLLTPSGQPAFPNAELVASQAELDFWLDEAKAAQAPDAMRPFFTLAIDSIKPYRNAGRVRSISHGDALPGVSIVPEHGHTPGHSGFMVKDGDASLLIWGDIVHLPGIQFANPDAGVGFDMEIGRAHV